MRLSAPALTPAPAAVAVGVAVAVAVAAGAERLGAQPATAARGRSSVAGVVQDDDGRPVPGAVVRFETLGRGVVTGEDGRFALAGLPAGRHPGTVRRLGFLPGDFLLELPSNVRVDVAVRMVASPTALPSVVVDGEQRDFLLHANGYYARARARNGVFLGPEFLSARPGVPLHTVLREVHRLRVQCDPSGARCATALDGPSGPCRPRLWVDGAVAPDGVLDEVVPRDRVRAVELYRSAPFVPPEFVRAGDVCGAVAIWTDQAPTWSRYLPRQVVTVPLPPPPEPASAPP